MGLLGHSHPIAPPKRTPLLSPCLKGRGFTRWRDNTTQLEYQDQFWQAEDGTLFVRMDHTTFNDYVQRYLVTLYGSDEPTVEQRGAAIAHCRVLSYWHTITDPAVRIGYKGGHKL